jgi:hypothetical protein
MPKTLVLVAFGLTTLAAGSAEAKQYRYIGSHPLSSEAFCYIEAPHVHVVPPYKKVLFRVHDDHHYFVGDPVAFGWEGDRHVYHGHHPIDVQVVIGREGHEFCYLDGPHYHSFTPGSGARYELKGGVYWYVGKMPRRYRREREVYGSINTIEVRYTRPVVTIEPPPAYVELYVTAPHVGVHAVGHAPHVRPHVPHVRPHVPHVRPVVGIVAPRPRVSIGVPAPSVRVEHRVTVEHRHDHGKKKGHKKHKRGRH